MRLTVMMLAFRMLDEMRMNEGCRVSMIVLIMDMEQGRRQQCAEHRDNA